MRFTRRLRAWLRGGQQPFSSAAATSPSRTRGTGDLAAFATSRRGVEAFLEPRTNLYEMSVLLVADDGEYLRRSVADPSEAQALCRRHGVPLYEAAKVGYPRRMRDFQQGNRRPPVELSDLPPWPGDEPDGTGSDHPDGRG